MDIYEVGGTVRDRLLGLESKDHDFTVVIPDMESAPIEDGYFAMREYLIDWGYKIFQESPDVATIRAKFPTYHIHSDKTADFVLARRETYVRGSRRPMVVVGSLKDDIFRRDFTVNAMAIGSDGQIIDMVDGQRHLTQRKLVTPLPAMDTFRDDPLRALRAVRFAVTKGFTVSSEIDDAMRQSELIELTKQTVSAERIREELTKAFKYDTMRTFKVLAQLPTELVEHWLTVGGMWLMPTFKK